MCYPTCDKMLKLIFLFGDSCSFCEQFNGEFIGVGTKRNEKNTFERAKKNSQWNGQNWSNNFQIQNSNFIYCVDYNYFIKCECKCKWQNSLLFVFVFTVYWKCLRAVWLFARFVMKHWAFKVLNIESTFLLSWI